MIMDAVRRRFPESKYTVVGGFVFLRLFCVAALAPEKHGFSGDAIPRNRNVRKILLQANRVIQNLSSNVLFGSKDSHMVVMNDFLTNNIYKVTTFLREISLLQASNNKANDTVTTSSKPHNMGNANSNYSTERITSVEQNQRIYDQLHRCLYDNLDRISRDLSGRRARSYGGYNVVRQPSSGQWKYTLDKLTKVLAELGRPGTLIQEDAPTYPKNTHAVSRSNHDFGEFMRRNSLRDITSIRSLNAVYQGGTSRAGNPVFYVIAHLVTADVDFELLIFYLLSVSRGLDDDEFLLYANDRSLYL
jgi:neurofibromin 1